MPRTGHVQATLLNPLGMVVRMFVVAYDFRDMPTMSQTFVRQRILSFDENANPGQSVDDLSPADQNKLLRYAIHLRFVLYFEFSFVMLERMARIFIHFVLVSQQISNLTVGAIGIA